MYVATVCFAWKALDKIDNGYRLPPPPGCPRTMYRAMIKCWYVFIATGTLANCI